MTSEMKPKLIQSLQRLYHESPAATSLFDCLAARKQDRQDTSVESIASEAKIDDGTAAKLLQAIAKAGAGTFKYGRHGYKSRIEWNYSLRNVGQIAKGKTDGLVKIADDAQTEREAEGDIDLTKYVDHRVTIRPGVEVRFKLPHDLTSKEAERLAGMIKLMPLD